MAETLELGGNIGLTGFSELDPGAMVVVKKIVGNYAKRFSEIQKEFEKLDVSLKTVHKKETSGKCELHALVRAKGKKYSAEVTEMNLFFALDKVLKKVENSISK
jgi:ribosome-associated translation inhibitor RaiA